MEEICSGWLTKSPSSKYVTLFSRGRFSIHLPVKNKWHKRYFILYKPQGSLPHQYNFDYYKDSRLRRKCGSINLEECTDILSALESSHYQHLFSIKTNSSKNKEKVYYFAAESESEMNKWVSCLCRLCDLALPSSHSGFAIYENARIAPSPPVRHDSMQLTVDLPAKAVSNQSLADEQLSNEILEEIKAMEQGLLRVNPKPNGHAVPEGYTELADCVTGDTGGPVELYDVPRSHQAPAITRLAQSHSFKLQGSNSLRVNKSSTLPAGVMLNSDFAAPPRPPKHDSKPEEMYQNITAANFTAANVRRSASPSSMINSSQLTKLPETNASHHKSEAELEKLAIYPNALNVRVPSPLSIGKSPSHSPATKAGTDNIASPGALRSKKPSVDSLYHNTMSLGLQPHDQSHEPLALMDSNVVTNSQHPTPRDLDSLYDIPKSHAFAPPRCPGPPNSSLHKYVNASFKVVSTLSENKPAADGIPNPSTTHTEIGARRGSLVEAPPKRPPKPRNLSDPTTLEELPEDHADLVVKVSKSFRTMSFQKDQVFRNTDIAKSKDNIQLPRRTTNKSSSSSSAESSDDEEEPAGGPGKVTENSHDPDMVMMWPKATPQKLSQSSNVKRSSSLTKVPAPATTKHPHPQTTGFGSPRLKHENSDLLRPERSSSVSFIDWKNRSIASPKVGLRHAADTLGDSSARTDIQYVELEPSFGKTDSPVPKRASVNSTPGQRVTSTELNYTDIDMLKTQALAETRLERDRNLRNCS